MNQNGLGNVLMVSNYPSDTAYAWWLMEHFWKTLAERFARAGRQAYLAYPRITSLSETITTAPIESVELSFPWKSRLEAKRICKFIREKNISSIYFTDQQYFNPQYAALRLNGVRRIIIHDHTPGDRPPVLGIKGILKASWNAVPWFTADCVLCISELMRQRNLTNARIPAGKCVLVQNGIPPVVCAGRNNNALRESLGVRPGTLLVVTTGRAHPYKRFDFIIECAALLRSKSLELDAVFLLVGDGPAMSVLQDEIIRSDLANSVRLLGFRSDVHDLLCCADLALHAALGEGFSLSITEYMSASLPVLVPDIPSVSQAIQHGKTGIIYPKDDAEVVATAIQALASDTGRRTAMGRAAKTRADNDFSLDQCTEAFLAAVETGFRLKN